MDTPASTKARQGSVSLLDLPGELRNKIYGYVLSNVRSLDNIAGHFAPKYYHSSIGGLIELISLMWPLALNWKPDVKRTNTDKGNGAHTYISLLLSCKQVHAELASIPYGYGNSVRKYALRSKSDAWEYIVFGFGQHPVLDPGIQSPLTCGFGTAYASFVKELRIQCTFTALSPSDDTTMRSSRSESLEISDALLNRLQEDLPLMRRHFLGLERVVIDWSETEREPNVAKDSGAPTWAFIGRLSYENNRYLDSLRRVLVVPPSAMIPVDFSTDTIDLSRINIA